MPEHAKPMKQTDDLKRVHALAIQRFDEIWDVAREEREWAVSDRRFCSIPGAMWEGDIGEHLKNKPKIEVNKVQQAVIRVINEKRNNPVTVNFISKDGSDVSALADVADGLYRADEQSSSAYLAYNTSFEEGVTGGYGAWRLTTVFEDEDDDYNENQRIRIETIHEADQSVFFDPDAKEQDKSDAHYCFVITSMSRARYEDKYKDSVSSWDKTTITGQFDWAPKDVVRVAEYYVIEKREIDIDVYKHINGDEERIFDISAERKAEFRATGTKKIKTVKKTKRFVMKYILSGNLVLSGPEQIAGRNIPIIPVYGKRFYIDNIERAMGMVRMAKDPARLKNLMVSSLAFASMTSPVQVPIFTAEQMKGGAAARWVADEKANTPFRVVNPVLDANGNAVPSGPIAYTKPPDVSPNVAALLQVTENDMLDILGNQQAGDQLVSNVSGEAIELIQSRLDGLPFIYMDNFSIAMKRSGQVWLSMAREIYVENNRKMKTVGKDGETNSVELGEGDLVDKGDGIKNVDLTKAGFDINVDVGPSSKSKRDATVKAILNLMQITQDPQTLSVLTAEVLKLIEGEGLGDLREWSRKKLVQMGVSKPTDQDLKEAADAQENQQPDPNAEFLQ
ncbi:MAG: hypothetical protein JKY94_02160, partial [Rhodobacteraceae bacterium]|nr:hypothetical protein [Paracoccaceae bacterium]